MGLLIAILALVAGVALLILGGDQLVRGAVALASRLGVPALLVGLTVVAFGTSAPELALNIVAATKGNDGLSFGNVVGSNIANVGLILGISAIVCPLLVNSSVVKRELPLMLLATGLLLGLVAIPLAPVMWRAPQGATPINELTRLEGGMLLVGFVVVLGLIMRAGLKNRDAREHFESEASAVEEHAGLPGAVVRVVVGLLGLLGGGWLAEYGASAIARDIGMSDELIGLTVVAIATSLPELATSLQAVRRGSVDIAVGNVVGSNIFNILLVLGATAAVNPVSIPADGLVPLGVMALTSLALLPMVLTGGRVVSRVEGTLLLIAYAGFMAWSVWAAGAPSLADAGGASAHPPAAMGTAAEPAGADGLGASPESPPSGPPARSEPTAGG
jgi:cation:H+ antiporter